MPRQAPKIIWQLRSRQTSSRTTTRDNGRNAGSRISKKTLEWAIAQNGVYDARAENALNCSLCKQEFEIFDSPEYFDCSGSGIGDALREQALSFKEKGQALMLKRAVFLKKIENYVAVEKNDLVSESFVSRWKLDNIDSGNDQKEAHDNWHALYQGTSMDRHAHEHMHYASLELAQQAQQRICGSKSDAQKESQALSGQYAALLVSLRAHEAHEKELPNAKQNLATILARIEALKGVIAALETECNKAGEAVQRAHLEVNQPWS